MESCALLPNAAVTLLVLRVQSAVGGLIKPEIVLMRCYWMGVFRILDHILLDRIDIYSCALKREIRIWFVSYE